MPPVQFVGKKEKRQPDKRTGARNPSILGCGLIIPPMLSAKIAQKFSRIAISDNHRLGTPWVGAFKRLAPPKEHRDDVSESPNDLRRTMFDETSLPDCITPLKRIFLSVGCEASPWDGSNVPDGGKRNSFSVADWTASHTISSSALGGMIASLYLPGYYFRHDWY